MSSPSFESYIPTLNAFASISVPADPAVTTAYAIPDRAAGSLTRTLTVDRSDPFGMQVIRFYRQGSAMQAFNFQVNEQDGITLCSELDLQAQNLGSPSFAALFVSNLAAATGIVADMLSGACTPLDPLSGGTAGIQYLATLGNFLVQLAYYNNFPEHTLRNDLLREGGGQPIYTDAPNLIAAPNNRPPGLGGTATFSSAADYTCYPYPLRKTLEDAYLTAFIDWQSNAPSSAAFTSLNAGWASGAILGVGT